MPRVAALHYDALNTSLAFLPRLHHLDSVVAFFSNVVMERCETWVAEDEQRLLGFISVRPDLIEHLYVEATAQRSGVGTALLACATRDGLPRALWTFQRNLPANRFYLARGWRPVEHTNGGRNDEREPDTRYVSPSEPEPFSLRIPGRDLLSDFIGALDAGWSPSSSHDTRAATLAALARDEAAFLAEMNGGPGRVMLDDGSEVDRLPGQVFWMWDGAFCGSINLRYLPGTEALPPHVSGHIGYVVVPWKQRRGFATKALAAILPHARAAGLARVSLTCDVDNRGSRAVIERNGGVFAGPAPEHKLLFWIGLDRAS